MDGEARGLEDIHILTHGQGIFQSSLKLRIKAPVLPPNIWSKITKEDLQGDNLRNALHFEVMMQVSTASIKCGAEVLGKMRDNEFLDGTKRGYLDCLRLGFVHQYSAAEGGRPYPYYFVIIVKHKAGKNTERVGILSFMMSGQDPEGQVLELAKEKSEFCFDTSIELR